MKEEVFQISLQTCYAKQHERLGWITGLPSFKEIAGEQMKSLTRRTKEKQKKAGSAAKTEDNMKSLQIVKHVLKPPPYLSDEMIG